MGEPRRRRRRDLELVVLTRVEFEALIAQIAREGAQPDGTDRRLIPQDVAQAMSMAPHPLGPIRKWRKLSQQALADRVGVSQPTISAIEAGSKEPRTRLVAKLSRALEVDLLDLVLDAP